MNPTVVEVGPQTVRGPNTAPQEWISVAVECIDDPIALLDERPVEVRRLWIDLLDVVAGTRSETLVLVVPTWWSTARIELVTDAGRGVSAEVVVLRRSAILAAADSAATVVEFSEEFAVVTPPASEIEVVARGEDDLAAHLGAAAAVVVDVPAGVRGPVPALFAGLRAAGIPVTH
ncbi:MAG TPA: type VII secretion-associated protein, partial [Mycobacterium sp.]